MFRGKEDLFNVFFDAASEGIIIVDMQQKMVAVNESAEEMFGYEKGALKNKKLETLIPRPYKENHRKEVIRFFEQNKRKEIDHGRDIQGVKKNGEYISLVSSLNPFVWQGEKYVMSLLIDISERKKTQLAIQELNENLERKIQTRTLELEDSIAQLRVLNLDLEQEIKRRKKAENKIKEALHREKELSNLKSKFLSMVSHEFKTPLSGISTSAMLAEKYTLTEQKAKREKHLNTIKSKVQYLNNILNDFLSIENMETGRIKYGFIDFNLAKLMNEVVYNANVTLKNGQEIKYDQEIIDIVLHQDEKILENILSNLLNNAIKYSPENTTIFLEVKTDKTYITFKIRDQGIGIPEEDQKHIFERYFRAENALLQQGTGIGLNTAQMHIQNLGGEISFSSQVGEGTTFWVKLPIRKI